MEYGGLAYICILNNKNQPVCLKGFGEVDDLDLQISAMASLDIIEEMLFSKAHSNQKEAKGGSAASELNPFLGLICPALSNLITHQVYAYVGATGFKIIAILENTQNLKLKSIRYLFDSVNKLYCKAVCSPFLDSNIDTPRFINNLEEIARNFHQER